jgi:hypothetical protein
VAVFTHFIDWFPVFVTAMKVAVISDTHFGFGWGTERGDDPFTAHISDLEDEITSLDEQAGQFQDFPHVKQALKEKQDTLETLQNKVATCTTRIETVQSFS